MSDSTSRIQAEGPSPEEDLQEGSTAEHRQAPVEAVFARPEDQPTVISKRPPLSTSPPGPRAKVQPSDIPPGARLEHFELLEYVGGGGMGRVFRALDTRLGRTVAVKVLSRQQAGDLETLMRFRNEGRSAARLNHPSIAQVFYVGEDNGLSFIAFEFVEGTNIRDLVAQKGALSLAEALSYTLQVAEALAHAASRNVVHRDIKPSNVLITSEGRAKLIDMGLARMQKLGTSSADLTASGVTLGTFDYISPEQARDPRNADARSDIYSLGCTLFFMLTGRPPFPEGTVLQKLLQHQEINPPDVRQFRPDLPDEVSRVLRKMMAKEPRQRYQDSGKLIEALLSLAEQIGLRPLGAGQMAWSEPEERRGSLLRRHLPWMAPTAALLVIVTLLQVFWASSAEEAERSWPNWSGDLQGWSAEVPRPKEKPSPGGVSPDKQVPAPESEGPLAKPVPAPEPAREKVGSAETPPPGTGPLPAAASHGPTGSPEKGGVASPRGLAGSNPLSTLMSGRNATGLRPELFDGGVALPEQLASGLVPSSPAGPDRGELTAASGVTAEPADAQPSVEPAPKGNAVLVVDPAGEGAPVFSTLSAACAAARPGDVIELRFNGRLEEEPLELANLDLTIRAAKTAEDPNKEYEPVVAFRPAEIDPIGYPRSMIALIGSRLTLTDVQIEFELPRELPSDRWSLFDLGQGRQLKLENSRLTIRNASDLRAAYHQEVAFLRLKAAPGSGLLLDDKPSDAAQRVAVELVDCVVRGEAAFLAIEDLRPVRVDWTNGFFVTTEQLLVSEGGERSPQPGEIIEINLRHLTAVADGGLCRLEHSEFAPYQLPLHVYCANTLVLSRPEVSLVEQVGVAVMEPSRERVSWVGDHNVYQGFTDFWTVRPLDPAIPAETWDFDHWRGHWDEETSRLDQIDEDDLPGPDRPAHSLEPTDYPSYPSAETTPEAVLPPNPSPMPKPTAGSRRIGYQVGG